VYAQRFQRLFLEALFDINNRIMHARKQLSYVAHTQPHELVEMIKGNHINRRV
jgi:hypothetical protein